MGRVCHYIRSVKPLAWVIVVGDSLHNLADGIALGAAISQGLGIGISTGLAILFHEIPHELGKFQYSILLNAQTCTPIYPFLVSFTTLPFLHSVAPLTLCFSLPSFSCPLFSSYPPSLPPSHPSLPSLPPFLPSPPSLSLAASHSSPQGDYVILLSTGMTWYVALIFNMLSSVGAIVGFFVGVTVGTDSESANGWILTITAGQFLYIALVDLVCSHLY